MQTNQLLDNLLDVVRGFLPLVGDDIQSVAERAVTVPESKIRVMCSGMTEAQTDRAIALFRRWADATSDAVCYVASRGAIEPD